jgi:small ligand-binding sensory domain FIST
MKVAATGLATGRIASPDLARQAVEQALAGLQGKSASSVLLFLSPDFANNPQPSLLAACKAAACTQLAGCTATGILTEKEWIQDAPAAAALALTAPLNIGAPQLARHEPILCLAAPNAINTNWLHDNRQRFGGVAGDATGQGAYKIWANGRVQISGLTQLQITGGTTRLLIAQGLQAVSTPVCIDQMQALEMQSLGGMPALEHLALILAEQPSAVDEQALRLAVCLAAEMPETAGDQAYYPLTLLQQNWRSGSISLTQALEPGQQVFWAVRNPEAAATSLHQQLQRYVDSYGQPDCVLMFSCAGRGPQFYGGEDRDWQAIRAAFPQTPLLGMYGNGQFAPLSDGNHLLDGTVVLAFCHGADHV